MEMKQEEIEFIEKSIEALDLKKYEWCSELIPVLPGTVETIIHEMEKATLTYTKCYVALDRTYHRLVYEAQHNKLK